MASARVSYEGFQVWRLEVEAKHHAPLRQMVDTHNLDVWAQGRDWMDVMVNPKMKAALGKELAAIGVHSTIMIDNIQPMIERDYQQQEQRNRSRATLDFEQYNLFEDIEAYLADLPAEDDRTSLVSLGQSVEGRDLWQLSISVGGDKPDIWIDCGIHAREWITPATCLWGINYLLTGYGSDQAATELLDAYDVFFLPVNNPDGYAYTQEDRMWRKNRNQYPGDDCAGIDLNRNFDDHFGGAGTSGLPCSETYRGPSAASEPETVAVQGGIDVLAPTGKALFSIHSYSQLWMYAFGWTSDLPDEAAELDAVSEVGVSALTAVYGTEYEYGPVSTTIYPAASTTVDYGYYAGIVHSYTLELRDTGSYGFLLPESQIAETAEETWAGLIAGILAIP